MHVIAIASDVTRQMEVTSQGLGHMTADEITHLTSSCKDLMSLENAIYLLQQ